jgi:hypothetical protein
MGSTLLRALMQSAAVRIPTNCPYSSTGSALIWQYRIRRMAAARGTPGDVTSGVGVMKRSVRVVAMIRAWAPPRPSCHAEGKTRLTSRSAKMPTNRLLASTTQTWCTCFVLNASTTSRSVALGPTVATTVLIHCATTSPTFAPLFDNPPSGPGWRFSDVPLKSVERFIQGRNAASSGPELSFRNIGRIGRATGGAGRAAGPSNLDGRTHGRLLAHLSRIERSLAERLPRRRRARADRRECAFRGMVAPLDGVRGAHPHVARLRHRLAEEARQSDPACGDGRVARREQAGLPGAGKSQLKRAPAALAHHRHIAGQRDRNRQ